MTTQRQFMSGLLGWGAVASDSDWEALYSSEMPRVYNFFCYRLGDEVQAEDLTSATFEKAWRGRARYRRDLAGFSTWLFSIARNVAIDYFRQRRNDIPLEDVRQQAEGRTLEDVVEKRATLAQLARLLSQLPERERELLALKYGAGLTNRVISKVTGLSESNVGTILYRSVSQLRSWCRRRRRHLRRTF